MATNLHDLAAFLSVAKGRGFREAARVSGTPAASDMASSAAVAGLGVIFLFEEWLQPTFDQGRLVPVLKSWWPSFSGPFLYYPGRRFMAAPLRAFVDFIRS